MPIRSLASFIFRALRKKVRSPLGRRTKRLAYLGSCEALEARYLLSAVVPNDPRFHQQWGLEATQAPEAWALTTGSTQTRVAIADSGIDYTHPDLYKNIWLNQDEIPAAIRAGLTDVDTDGLITFWDLNEAVNQGEGKIADLNGNGYIDGGDLLRPVTAGGWADGLDNGGNGYADDLIGWDFYDNDNDPMDNDSFGHGTAVAGIIGAIGDNGEGVTGINWRVQMMALRNQELNGAAIFNTPGGLERVLNATVDAVIYASDNGARVINISGSAPSALVAPEIIAATDSAIEHAAANDVLVVVAAGNEGVDTDLVPYLQSATPHDNVITVAATFRQQDNLAFFGTYWASNYGATTVDLAAPGDYLWTTHQLSQPGISYTGVFGGTSGATPFVSGAAALVLSVNPGLTYDEIRDLIFENVDPVEDLQGITVTGGRLNLFRTLTAASLGEATEQLDFLSAPVGNTVGVSELLATETAAADDPRLKQQYNLDSTEVHNAWSLTTGSTEVTVAVIDTGVDYLHPDLYLNIWINQEEIPTAIRPLLTDIDGDGLITFWDLNDTINIGPTTITDLNGTGYIDGGDLLFSVDMGGWADGSDNGQNGFVDDLVGWDFGDNDNDPLSLDSHGTRVAGVIGAIGNNDLGVAGINWQVQIMPVKIAVGANRMVSGEAVSPSIYYAVNNGARISNHSYGDFASNLPPDLIAVVREAVDYAAAHDHLLVAAAGNQAMDTDITPFLPADYDASNVISVAATDRHDGLAKFSNYGTVSVDLGAPGVGIWTTSLNGRYAKLDGTSVAAPHVAGAAALLLALDPNLSADELKSLILNNVDPLADLEGITVTGGRLNLFSAMTAATEQLSSPAANIEGTGVGFAPFVADGLSEDVSEGSLTSVAGIFQNQAVDVVSADPKDWAMFGHDAQATRYNPTEHTLTSDTVPDLGEIWRFPTDGAVAGTPAVVNDIVYAADTSGAVYAVNRDGTLKWKTVLAVNAFVGAKITASPLVTNRTIILGDNAGFIHGLDVETGEVKWSVSPNPHPFAAIFGNGTMVGNYVAFGTSSFELLVPALDPSYTNFTFRGSVVLLDPADGSIIWQTFTITDAEQAEGASGATVWGAPVYDRGSDTIIVGTSNNYSQPTTETSDALIAFDAKTGAIKWVSQKTGGDHWNFSFLPEDPDDPPDFDFGDTPQLYRLNGRLVVAAGQKSGFLHVVDAETGAEIAPPQQFLAGDHLGGFHIDSPYANGINYVPGNDWFDPFSGNPPTGGHLFAISADGTETIWEVDLAAPVISGAAVAGGVVYVQSIDGLFYGFDAQTGEELIRLETGGQNSGPAISRGRIYLGTGDSMSAVFNPFFSPGPAEIISLGLVAKPNNGNHENSPPTFINRTVTSLVKEGEFVTLTGTIVDPDPLDTFYLTVDWGDGRVETFKFSPKFNGQTVSITHLYEKPGTYEIEFSWQDRRDFGNTAILTTTVVESLGRGVEQLGESLTDVVLDADIFDELN